MSKKLTLKEAAYKVFLPQLAGALIAIVGIGPRMGEYFTGNTLENLARDNPKAASGLAETLAEPTDSFIANLFGYGSMKAAREYIENTKNKKE